VVEMMEVVEVMGVVEVVEVVEVDIAYLENTGSTDPSVLRVF
jgi:hypothetical protein